MNIPAQCLGENLISERRLLDTPDLRVSELISPARPACIALLRDRLSSSLQEFGVRSETALPQICMALEEALANAVYHGNLELDSELKEDGTELFTILARKRCELAPWNQRRVYITELAAPLGLWITIRDEGCGFDVRSALKRTENPLSILASGRGLMMMKAFTDELVFNRVGNEVTLVVYNVNQDVTQLLQERARTRRHYLAKQSTT
jgi:anti-sigma regulatory factor (Ser/Thr protein kinase)